MQSLKWSVISFTEKGAELAEKIKRLSQEQQLPCEIHTYHGSCLLYTSDAADD